MKSMATATSKRKQFKVSSMMAFTIIFLFVFLPSSSSISSSSLDLEQPRACINDADGSKTCGSKSSTSNGVYKDHRNEARYVDDEIYMADGNYDDNSYDEGNTFHNINISQKEIPNSIACLDDNDNCAFGASVDECDNNPVFMLESCRNSCGTCKSQLKSGEDNLDGVIYRGEGIGELQTVNGDRSIEVITKLQEIQQYVSNVLSTPEYDSVRDECLNRHKDCAFWAVIGECDANPDYMKLTCAPACMTCHLLDIKVRCPMDPNAKDAFLPGELHQMFERIEKEYDGRGLIVYSKPGPNYPEGWEKSEYDGIKPIDGPWVLTIDEFLTPEECDELIEQGYKSGYERSTDVGAKTFDGSLSKRESSSRTSWNAWCFESCMTNPTVNGVMDKVVNLTTVPSINSESFQLLRYEVGQFYKTHHDFIPQQVRRPCGGRILTAFLYLNDVESGGGTNFPRLGLTVNPKKGRLLLWPSVMNDNLNSMDSHTIHQALKVEQGMKYASNSWLHLRDYETPNKKNCS